MTDFDTSQQGIFLQDPIISVEHYQEEKSKEWQTIVTVEHGIASRTYETSGKLNKAEAKEDYLNSRWHTDLTDPSNASGFCLGILINAGWIEGAAPFYPLPEIVESFPANNTNLTDWEVLALNQPENQGTDSLGFAALVWAIEQQGYRYEPVWYAAQVARHFFGPKEAHFNAGYFFRELTMRFRYETNALRGQKTKASASLGGQATARKKRCEARQIVTEMRKRINLGHSISNAANIVHKAGHGPSQEANRKCYYRFIE